MAKVVSKFQTFFRSPFSLKNKAKKSVGNYKCTKAGTGGGPPPPHLKMILLKFRTCFQASLNRCKLLCHLVRILLILVQIDGIAVT
uniref:Uncharacterized protein n=1 Tax=Romanomermis culicivorax TaxID=13658 RepID=A0A915JAR0_ROMCU